MAWAVQRSRRHGRCSNVVFYLNYHFLFTGGENFMATSVMCADATPADNNWGRRGHVI